MNEQSKKSQLFLLFGTPCQPPYPPSILPFAGVGQRSCLPPRPLRSLGELPPFLRGKSRFPCLHRITRII
jgi:hypothetical protein